MTEALTQQDLCFEFHDEGITLLLFTHNVCSVSDDFFRNAMTKVGFTLHFKHLVV